MCRPAAAILVLMLALPGATALSVPGAAWSSEPLAVSRDSVQSVAFAPDGRVVAVGTGADAHDAAGRVWQHAPDGTLAFRRALDGVVTRLDAVAVAPDGSILVAGTARGAHGEGALVARLDADGHPRWSTILARPLDAGARGIAVDADGNTFVVGVVSSPQGRDAFVAKLDREGGERWVRTIDVGAHEEALAVAARPDGTIVVGGRSLADGEANALLRAFDASGQVRWTNLFAGPAFEEVTTLAVAPDGATIFGGSRSTEAAATRAPWVGRLADGRIAWQLDLPVDGEARGVALDQGGDIVIAGATHGAAPQAFMAKAAANGTLLWMAMLDRANATGLDAVSVHENGTIAVAGTLERADGLRSAVVAAYPQAITTPFITGPAVLGIGQTGVWRITAWASQPPVASATWTFGGALGEDGQFAFDSVGEKRIVVAGRNAEGIAFRAERTVVVVAEPVPLNPAFVVPAGIVDTTGFTPPPVPWPMWALGGLLVAGILAGLTAGALRMRRYG